MSMATEPDEREAEIERPGSVRELVRRSLITGTAVVIPLVVTALILRFALNSISGALQPIVDIIRAGPVGPNQLSDALLKMVAAVVFLVVVFALGFVTEFSKRGTKAGEQFDELMAAIPGIGSVYTSFDEMSDVILDSDTDSFKEVKLVEYPGEGSYTVAFKTASTMSVIEEAAERDDMVTLFMPMAPNPVMGGFVIHVSRDRVVDVDLSVEQGIRSIVTSGVAVGDHESPELRGLSATEMRTLGRIERVDQQTHPGTAARSTPESGVARARIAEYDAAVDPEHSDTPGKIADRTRDDRDTTESVPAEASGRDPDDRESMASTPAEAAGRDREDRDGTGTPPAERTSDDG